jgi:predicted small secreted protein
MDKQSDSTTAARQKLAKEFEDSLKQMKDASAHHQTVKGSAVSYGQQRYGEKEKKMF